MKCPHCGGEIACASFRADAAESGPDADCVRCGYPQWAHLDSVQSKGGHARSASLTKAQRKEIARKAAAARWKNHTPKRKRKQR